MTDKNLKKLSRETLLEMLLAQSKEVEDLRKQNRELTRQLESRRILMENAGSIAEAALQLNQIFETAQRAADQYLENVRQSCEAVTDGKNR